MEHGMNLPRLWDFKFVGDGRQDLDDSEWSFLFQSELWIGYLPF